MYAADVGIRRYLVSPDRNSLQRRPGLRTQPNRELRRGGTNQHGRARLQRSPEILGRYYLGENLIT